jgi:hypothetical protein
LEQPPPDEAMHRERGGPPGSERAVGKAGTTLGM